MSLNYENFQVQMKPDDFTLSGFLLNTIGNRDFYDRIFQALTKSTKSNFWKNLDHVLNIEDCEQPIFNIIYNNIKYYLDNVSNVDLCKVKALQSIISYYGVSYDVFNYLKDMPIELYNMLNLFSINRYYLFDRDRGVLDKALKERIYQEVKPETLSVDSDLDIPIKNMSQIVVGQNIIGHLEYNRGALGQIYEISSWIEESTDTWISTALSVGPDGQECELSVETNLHYNPDTGEYAPLSNTVSDYVLLSSACSLSDDYMVNKALFWYLIDHPGKHVWDDKLIPGYVTLSGWSNDTIRKHYKRLMADAEPALASAYSEILSNRFSNELEPNFGNYQLLSVFDQSSYDVNLREVYVNDQTRQMLYKLYIKPQSKFVLQYNGFKLDDGRYMYVLQNENGGYSMFKMDANATAYRMYTQLAVLDKSAKISSIDEIPSGAESYEVLEEVEPAISAVTYEIDSLDLLEDNHRDLTQVGASTWRVTYDEHYPEDIKDLPVLDVVITRPGLSSATYAIQDSVNYFFADYYNDKLYTNEDDSYANVSTYIISIDLPSMLSSEEHGYDIVSEGDLQAGLPGSLMLVGKDQLSDLDAGADMQFAQSDVSYYDYTHIDYGKYRQMIADAYRGLIVDKVKTQYAGGEYVYKTLYDVDDLTQQAAQLKNELGVPLSFNESLAADQVENGVSSLSDYDAKRAQVIQFELDKRKLPSDPARYDSRYAYYRKQKVQQYVEYVESLYNIFYNKDYRTYDVDKSYFNLDDSSYVTLVQKIDGDVKLNEEMFDAVAQTLADMTLNVVGIRDKIKTMVERNSVRGTWLIVALYVIEYFKNVVKNNYKQSAAELTIDNFDIVEYYDNTEYFNIESNELIYTPEQRSQLNTQFWNETRTGTIGADEIDSFYRDLIVQASRTFVDAKLSVGDFLQTLYRAGANKYYSVAGNPNYDAYDIVQSKLDKLSAGMSEDQLSTIADQVSAIIADQANSQVSVFTLQPSQRDNVNFEEMLSVYGKYMYSTEDTQRAVYNVKSTIHPSYQIHPYVYDFTQTTNIKSPVESHFHCSVPADYDTMVSARIDEYIGALGQIRDIWKYDMFDFTGYASSYETMPNQGDFLEKSPYCDRDGMFIEEAVSAYLDDYVAFTDQLLSVENGRIVNPFYRHLNMGYAERQAEAAKLKTWYRAIYQLLKERNYDIYSYAKDIHGDHYAVYKSYYYADPTASQKRDTPGTLWVRERNHPIAFPAFDLYQDQSGDFTYFRPDGNRETTSMSYLGRIDSVAKVHGIVTNPADFPAGFYDFDFDKSLQNLMLFAPDRQYGDIGGYRNCDVIVGRIRKVFDSDSNSWYCEYDKLENFVQKLRNPNIRKSEFQKTWQELIGAYKDRSQVHFLYVEKYLNDDNSESLYNEYAKNTTYQLKLTVDAVDFSDLQHSRYQQTVKGLEYDINDPDFSVEYTGNLLTIAYIGHNTQRTNFVINYVENSNNKFTYDQISQIVQFDNSLSDGLHNVEAYDGGYVQYNGDVLDKQTYQYQVSSRVNYIVSANVYQTEYILVSRLNDEEHYEDSLAVAQAGLPYSQYLISDLYGIAQYPFNDAEDFSDARDNRFDAFDNYLVAVNFQIQGGKLSQTGDPQYYNLNSDPQFLPSYPNAKGKMRIWLNDTLSSHLSAQHAHWVQMMGKASPYYNDIIGVADIDDFVENRQAGQTYGIRWEQYPLISSFNVRPENQVFDLSGIVNENDAEEISVVALTRPIVSAMTFNDISGYIDSSASRNLVYDPSENKLTVLNYADVQTVFFDREITVDGVEVSSRYYSDLSVLDVWDINWRPGRMQHFDLQTKSLSTYTMQEPRFEYVGWLRPSVAGAMTREYFADSGVVILDRSLAAGGISAFGVAKGASGLSVKENPTVTTWKVFTDVSAVDAGVDFDYDSANEYWYEHQSELVERYGTRERYLTSLSNRLSVYSATWPTYPDMDVKYGISASFDQSLESPSSVSVYYENIPMRKYVLAFYKKYQAYSSLTALTQKPLSSIAGEIDPANMDEYGRQRSDLIEITRNLMVLSAEEDLRQGDSLSSSSWIINVYKRYDNNQSRIILYSMAVGNDAMFTNYYGNRLYQENIDSAPVRISNQHDAKSYNIIYVEGIQQISARTNVTRHSGDHITIGIELNLSAQYTHYTFDTRTFEYDLIPVDYINYAEFEQYHILQLNDSVGSVGDIKFDAEHGPYDIEEFSGDDPALAFKYQNEADISEISSDFPPLMNTSSRQASKDVFDAYSPNSVTDIKTRDQFVVELDEIQSKTFDVEYVKRIVSEEGVVTQKLSTQLSTELERLSGYYALKDNDFQSDDIYLYFNYNNDTANSFIAPFYKYSYAIIPPGETRYLGLFNQINQAFAYDISDPHLAVCSTMYSIAYLAGYRIQNISDERPKYAATALPLSQFLNESGLYADMLSSNLNNTEFVNDFLSNALSTGVPMKDQTTIWPLDVDQYLSAYETQRRGFMFQNPNEISTASDRSSETHRVYTEDDVKAKLFDYFIAGDSLTSTFDLSTRLTIGNFINKNLVSITRAENESQVQDEEHFYINQYSSYYTGPARAGNYYLQYFYDVVTLVNATIPVFIRPLSRYIPFRASTVAGEIVDTEDGDDIQLEDYTSLASEKAVLNRQNTQQTIYAYHEDRDRPGDIPYNFTGDKIVDRGYTHSLKLRDVYDLYNNHGAYALSLLMNYQLSDAQVYQPNEGSLTGVSHVVVGNGTEDMELSNVFCVAPMQLYPGIVQLSSSVGSDRISTVVQFGIDDSDWQLSPGSSNQGFGPLNLWTNAPGVIYDRYSSASQVGEYTMNADIYNLARYRFNTRKIVPIDEVELVYGEGSVSYDDFYTEDFYIDYGEAEVVRCIIDEGYGFHFTKPAAVGTLKVLVTSKPYEYIGAARPVLTINMTNSKAGLALSAESAGSYYQPPQHVRANQLDLFNVYAQTPFKTCFEYKYKADGVNFTAIECESPLSVVEYTDGYKTCVVQPVSSYVSAYVNGAWRDIQMNDPDLQAWVVGKNTNMHISAQIQVDVQSSAATMKAYHYLSGLYVGMDAGYEFKMYETDQTEIVRLNMSADVDAVAAYANRSPGPTPDAETSDFFEIEQSEDKKVLSVKLNHVYRSAVNPHPLSVFLEQDSYYDGGQPVKGCIQFYIDVDPAADTSIKVVEGEAMRVENEMTTTLRVDKPFLSVETYDATEISVISPTET